MLEHQRCKVCGRRDKFNFDIPDDLWRKVVPPEYQDHVVCLSCFDDFARVKEVDYSTSFSVLYFAGDMAVFTFKVLSAVSSRD